MNASYKNSFVKTPHYPGLSVLLQSKFRCKKIFTFIIAKITDVMMGVTMDDIKKTLITKDDIESPFYKVEEILG